MSESTEATLLELMNKITAEINDIKTAIALQVSTLQNHTDSDSQNFTSLNTNLQTVLGEISRLREDMHAIQLERAHEAGERVAVVRAGRNAGIRWAAGIGTGLAAFLEAIRWLWSSGGSGTQ